MFEAATMQAMPNISWGQRETSAGPADVLAVDDICEAHTIADLSLQGK